MGRALVTAVFLASLVAGTTAARASVGQSTARSADAAQLGAGPPLRTVEVAVAAVAITVRTVLALVERPDPADAHQDPRPCDQW